MLSGIRRLLVLCLYLASTVLTGVSGGGTAHAAADPTVMLCEMPLPYVTYICPPGLDYTFRGEVK